MADAQVTRIAALADFRSALAKFAAEAGQALIDIDLEVRRALDWITHDRAVYWRDEARRASDAVARAKDELANSRTFKRVGDYIPACLEEKKTLENAKRRLEHAEQKLAIVRYWSHAAPRAVDEFQGPVQQLMGMLDGDLPRAMAVLSRMHSTLERYAAGGTPDAIRWEDLVGPEDGQSVARSGKDRETEPTEAAAAKGPSS